MPPFRVGLTRDFLDPQGELSFGDIGLGLLDEAPGVAWEFLAEDLNPVPGRLVGDYDALLVLAPRITAETLAEAERLSIVARFGVGYDSVDVDACTERGVALTITPDGVRRPVAVATLTYILALTHKLRLKDRLTRAGGWAEKLNLMGQGVTGRTVGLIGLGNIGQEVAGLAQAFDLRVVASDPFVSPEQAPPGVEMLPLEALLRRADYVCVCCVLVPATHHLLNAERLALMKPSAYLINVARGPIVDQAALTEALQQGRLQGAGLDVFEQEPPDPDDPLLKLENVIVSPHAICWTDECFLGIGRDACRSILEVAAGRAPSNVVNRAVLEQPRFAERLRRYAAGNEAG